MSRAQPREPRLYVARGGAWPTGPFRRATPIDVLSTAVIVQRLEQAVREASVALDELAGQPGVGVQVLADLLAGRRVPTLHLLASLERVLLPVRLFPSASEVNALKGVG